MVRLGLSACWNTECIIVSLDELFNRMSVSEVLSQVANLKQQGILHQVSVGLYIQRAEPKDKECMIDYDLYIVEHLITLSPYHRNLGC